MCAAVHVLVYVGALTYLDNQIIGFTAYAGRPKALLHDLELRQDLLLVVMCAAVHVLVYVGALTYLDNQIIGFTAYAGRPKALLHDLELRQDFRLSTTKI
ncbi:uncharacterized protein N7483_002573 [Penicillium malachiteum]|uniref:uncharacterized protein n=1 Tax=Penicillium malachiteum TaxID=1324776 RepID=UPI002546A78D|nr:uncharacterized protein N7483_002573 [Penicillium malachiteum]KAJ5737448.1 hypothetical protein N7483_002573 [Penicillium malachiteum]